MSILVDHILESTSIYSSLIINNLTFKIEIGKIRLENF